MNGKMSIDLDEAKESFIDLMRSLRKSDQQKFLAFIVKEWGLEQSTVYNDAEDDVCDDDKIMDNAIFLINCIASDIKQKIPFNAIMPSENIIKPLSGTNSDCDPNITMHIDEFLYTNEDISELVANKEVQQYYCVDCQSRNIESLICISHSMSREDLYYIFNRLLPTLKDKTILDIGSRLGAVLYGAYVYTNAKSIIGVEMNEEFCNLQNDIIHKYKMDDRISILHSRIEEIPDIIKQSDIIIIHNPFEFYLPKDVQIDIWEFLKTTIKQGTILVTRPSIETMFRNLHTGITAEKWLRLLEKSNLNKFSTLFTIDIEEYSDIMCYEVL